MLQLVPSSYNLGVGGQHAPRPCMQPLLERSSSATPAAPPATSSTWRRIFPRNGRLVSAPSWRPAPDPDSTLHFLDRLHREQPGAFSPAGGILQHTPDPGGALSCSRFLSEAVLVHPDWLVDLIAGGDLDRPLPAEAYKERLEEIPQRRASSFPHRSPWPDSGRAPDPPHRSARHSGPLPLAATTEEISAWPTPS